MGLPSWDWEATGADSLRISLRLRNCNPGYLVVVEAVGSLGQSLILVKYLVFPVIPAGINLNQSSRAQPRECEQTQLWDQASGLLWLLRCWPDSQELRAEPQEEGISPVSLSCPLPEPFLPTAWPDHM